ncbi:HEPN/Toprim-associated domain-containing protein [Microbispora sp. GKU 823]|uniref:HEPN/Toprim-associated domain-containing protein n=1 Tax=Microbispora sp. GKU 823 TaxID=1652100 RepID=UPI00117D8300|nr:HEPN/Toprim-associated domain-containing protein [Microbispora sp. GKU 823]
MGSYGYLKVDSITVGHYKNGLPAELLAVFRDDMINYRSARARDYYGEGVDDEHVEVIEFRAPGQRIADRLDVMGIDAETALSLLDQVIDDERDPVDHFMLADPEFDDLRESARLNRAALESLDAKEWVAQFPNSPTEVYADDPWPLIGSRSWLLDLLDKVDDDDRFSLRLILLALPEAEVILDVTDLVSGGWLPDQPLKIASGGMDEMRTVASTHAPTVVLTEGRTDAEFLSAALSVLHPHLTDLIRFLDFDQRNEGGAGALVRLVRAFAAAGIANKVVALFDNDSAASDALRVLNTTTLPPNIRVVRYPDIDLASTYPTLGPPTMEAPRGSLDQANVNGLAGSIELYLGRDVLTLPDGAFRPVQWQSLHKSGYHGVVTDKDQIHELFRAKVDAARRNPSKVAEQDWDGLCRILDKILTAFRSSRG